MSPNGVGCIWVAISRIVWGLSRNWRGWQGGTSVWLFPETIFIIITKDKDEDHENKYLRAREDTMRSCWLFPEPEPGLPSFHIFIQFMLVMTSMMSQIMLSYVTWSRHYERMQDLSGCCLVSSWRIVSTKYVHRWGIFAIGWKSQGIVLWAANFVNSRWFDTICWL